VALGFSFWELVPIIKKDALKQKKMKNIAVIWALLLGISCQGQVNFSAFYSSSFQKRNVDEKSSHLPFGFNLGFDVNENFSLAVQYRNLEVWRPGDNVLESVEFRTYSIRFCLAIPDSSGKRWYAGPVVGIFAGIGKPFPAYQALRQAETDLRDYPYFGGIFFQANAGYNLNSKLRIGAFVRLEAAGGIIFDKPYIESNAITNGIISFGLRLSSSTRNKSG
jgi:hypothetical protein